MDNFLGPDGRWFFGHIFKGFFVFMIFVMMNATFGKHSEIAHENDMLKLEIKMLKKQYGEMNNECN